MAIRTLTVAAGALLATTSLAAAVPAVFLTGDRTLTIVDSENWEVQETMDVEGVERLHGIDFRPADGELYGVDDQNRIVRIDVETGASEEVSTLNTEVPTAPAPSAVNVDFNPAADRLRVTSGTTNLRINVDTGEVTTDGELAFADGDDNAGTTPDIAAVAYTNSFETPESTAMYDIDSTLGMLIQQTAPNDGTLETRGGLGIEGTAPYAFDIHSADGAENTAWLVTAGNVYTVDLETGAATEVGPLEGVEGDVRDVSFMPGPAM